MKYEQFELQMLADLERLQTLEPKGGFNSPSFNYLITMTCGICGADTKTVWLSLNKTVDISTNKEQKEDKKPEKNKKKAKGKKEKKAKEDVPSSHAHHFHKCKKCSESGYVVMRPLKVANPLTLDKSRAAEYVPLMHFDFWGYKPKEFLFGEGWQAVSDTNILHHGIELTKGGTTLDDKEEDGHGPIKITNLRAKFVTSADFLEEEVDDVQT